MLSQAGDRQQLALLPHAGTMATHRLVPTLSRRSAMSGFELASVMALDCFFGPETKCRLAAVYLYQSWKTREAGSRNHS